MGDSRLAIEGGSPVRRTPLPYGRHAIADDDVEAVVAALRSGWLTTGPRVDAFERALEEVVGRGHAVTFSSGTTALHGATHVAGVGEGDEVITTPLTFCATANAVLYEGARPVFADVEPGTLNLDPAQVERHIGARTRAILAVHYAGHPADMDALAQLARAHGLVLIEDACHALGARWRGRPAGSLGDLAAFSFHPVKHVAAGEGGALLARSSEHAAALRSFRNHGIDVDARARAARGDFYYEVRSLGINGRLSDLACALGLSQLRQLEAGLARRREIAARYAEAFAGLPIELPPERPEVEHAWHLYPVRLALEGLREDRGQVFRALREEGLGVAVHYVPVHLHPYYQRRLGTAPGDCPVAEEAYARLISLPMFPSMSDADVEDVLAAVTKVLGHYAR